MDKTTKVAFVAVAVGLFVALVLFSYFQGKEEASSIVPSIRRTCDFVELEDTLYAFCDDGSEFRVLDAVTPTPSPKE